MTLFFFHPVPQFHGCCLLARFVFSDISVGIRIVEETPPASVARSIVLYDFFFYYVSLGVAWYTINSTLTINNIAFPLVYVAW